MWSRRKKMAGFNLRLKADLKFYFSSIGYIMITWITCIYSYNCFGTMRWCFSELCFRKKILATESSVVFYFSNDISYSSNILNFFLFADDADLLFADKNFRSLELTVNRELAIVCNWLMASLNTKKSSFIIFRPYQKWMT